MSVSTCHPNQLLAAPQRISLFFDHDKYIVGEISPEQNLSNKERIEASAATSAHVALAYCIKRTTDSCDH